MRRHLLLTTLFLSLLGTTAARASGGAVVMIPIALAAQLIGWLDDHLGCHPRSERVQLGLESIEIDGAPVAIQPEGPFYVAAYEPGRIVAVLADPLSSSPGAARPQAMIVPVLP